MVAIVQGLSVERNNGIISSTTEVNANFACF